MIAIILGTRPEIIKMSPIIRECQRRNLDYYIIHTGQHYSYEMDQAFFEDLKLPQPKYNLDAGSGTHADQTGKIMLGIEKILMNDEPDTDLVLVQGDTNTVHTGEANLVSGSYFIGEKADVPIYCCFGQEMLTFCTNASSACKTDGRPRCSLDVSRAEKKFGFRLKTSFEDGLREIISGYEKTTAEGLF
ncbi:MAG: UDP-N-acetylglucosamine 2-epimerase [Deltaproteobacteria bacterium]|nr:UDP-N-acetylglucosamine 2-epimerase [Deltaproteobacteria bacterium]